MTKKLALALSLTASAALIAGSAIASPAQGGVKLHTTLTGVPPSSFESNAASIA